MHSSYYKYLKYKEKYINLKNLKKTKITKLRGGMTPSLYEYLDHFENSYRGYIVDNEVFPGTQLTPMTPLSQMTRQTAVYIPLNRSVRYTDILQNIQYKYHDENKESAFRQFLIDRGIDYNLFNNPININVCINNIFYELFCMPDTTIVNIKIKIIEEYKKKWLNINNNENYITNMSQEFYNEFIKIMGDTSNLFNNFNYSTNRQPLDLFKLKHKNDFLDYNNSTLFDNRISTGAEIILEINNNI